MREQSKRRRRNRGCKGQRVTGIRQRRIEEEKEANQRQERKRQDKRRAERRGGEVEDSTVEERDGAERHMTGPLWRLMTSPCQSSSHRESRALPSAPKLMGRRQGGEVRCVDAAQRGRRERGWEEDGGLVREEDGWRMDPEEETEASVWGKCNEDEEIAGGDRDDEVEV